MACLGSPLSFVEGGGCVNWLEWRRREPWKLERPVMLDGKSGSPEWPVARMTWCGWRVPVE